MQAAGATLVAISPQLPEHNREVAERHRLSFAVLSDRGNAVARRFGLVFRVLDDVRALYQKWGIDLASVNGDDAWTLPMPARFVIDGGGVIRAADADPDYTRRPEPAATVAALRALTSNS